MLVLEGRVLTTPPTTPIDPTCAFHGKRWSEHEGGRCLYCPLCFRSDLDYPKAVDAAGRAWDVCVECYLAEWFWPAKVPTR